MILMGNSKVVWEGGGREAPPYPEYATFIRKGEKYYE